MKNYLPVGSRFIFILTCLLTTVTSFGQTAFIQKIIPGYNTVGRANWTIKQGVIQADSAHGFIVTPTSYKDFTVILEFWKTPNTEAGVMCRVSDAKAPNKKSA